MEKVSMQTSEKVSKQSYRPAKAEMEGGKVTIPRSRKDLRLQPDAVDVSDEFFHDMLARPTFLPIHIISQIICFLIFFGPFKVIFGFLSLLLWGLVLSCLPLFQRFFQSSLRFKTIGHGICRYFVRLLLFCLGILRIDQKGKVAEGARIYVSNSISLLDYLIHFDCQPITIVKKSETVAWERLLLGSVFDGFRCRKGKRSPGQQIANVASDPSFFPLLVFPEGGETNGDGILSFELDCFENEYEVQPVTLRYTLYLSLPGFSSLRFDGKSFLAVIWRVLAVPFMTCEVSYLPVPELKHHLSADLAEERARVCQVKMANQLGVFAVNRRRPKK